MKEFEGVPWIFDDKVMYKKKVTGQKMQETTNGKRKIKIVLAVRSNDDDSVDFLTAELSMMK